MKSPEAKREEAPVFTMSAHPLAADAVLLEEWKRRARARLPGGATEPARPQSAADAAAARRRAALDAADRARPVTSPAATPSRPVLSDSERAWARSRGFKSDEEYLGFALDGAPDPDRIGLGGGARPPRASSRCPARLSPSEERWIQERWGGDREAYWAHATGDPDAIGED